ncbi:MAG: hypothetical protein IKF99_13755 [Oscillospiraceae bacterium]|nr:hypothetical protein [Oscillospiraceae bacterium]
MIDEQRFDPFSEKQQKGDELLKRSLIYERAKSMVEEAAQKVARDRKAHLKKIAETREDYDPAYDLAFQELRAVQDHLGAKADELWKQMEQATEKFGPGLQRLANAVLAKAAYDYEVALCGGFPDSDSEIMMIEKFANHGAEMYTTLDFSEVLWRVRTVYKEEWLPTVKKIVPELREEKTRHFRHKCPLCGGGLYYVHAKGQSDLIRCTSCGLFHTVKKERKKHDE